MRIRDHWLDDDSVTTTSTVNQGGELRPEFLVMHYTAGGSAQSTVDYFRDSTKKVSAHIVIGGAGEVFQVVAFNRKAWHAGESQWAGREGLNQYSIGLELANAGRLKRVGTQYQTWLGRVVPDSEVLEARHKHESANTSWHAYTERQLEVALQVAALVVREYGLHDVIGHDDIAPGRKVDPGPAFPMGSFRSHLFGRAMDEAEHFEVVAELLNVRSGPSTVDPIVMRPLPKGTRLDLLEMQSRWAKVRVPVVGKDGWVKNTFIRRQER